MIVFTDTSVVLNLCWLRRKSLLSVIYEGVLAPEQVRLEFERTAATDPRFTGLIFPPFITIAQPVVIPSALASNTALDDARHRIISPCSICFFGGQWRKGSSILGIQLVSQSKLLRRGNCIDSSQHAAE